MCVHIYIYIHRWLIVRLCSTEIASIRLGMFPSWRWTKDTIERWGERYYYRHYYSALCSRIAPFLRSKRLNFELGGKGGCYLWLARRHLTEGDRCVSRGIRRLLLMVDREMEKRWSPRIGLLFVEYVNGDELFDITALHTKKYIFHHRSIRMIWKNEKFKIGESDLLVRFLAFIKKLSAFNTPHRDLYASKPVPRAVYMSYKDVYTCSAVITTARPHFSNSFFFRESLWFRYANKVASYSSRCSVNS